MLIFQCDPCPLSERHLKIAVKPSRRNHADRKGIDDTVPGKAAAEEVPERALHRRCLLIIPVHPQHQIAQNIIVLFRLICYRDPDMIDHARPFDICQRCHASGSKVSQTRRTFSGRSQIAGCHPALSFFACRIFCIDRTASASFCCRQI